MTEEFVHDIIENMTTDGSPGDGEDTGSAADPTLGLGDQEGSASGVADLPPTEKTTSEASSDPKTTDTDVADSDPKVDPESGDESSLTDPAMVIENLATQLGWNKEHTGENAVDAQTYILRSREIQDSMRDHNKDLKNQVQNLQVSIDALKKHNEQVFQVENRKLQTELARLQEEKDAAIELADVAKVKALDKQIDDVQKNINQPVVEPQKTANPVFNEWVKDNQWYLTDDDMAAYADQVAIQYEGAPLERVYNLVRTKVAEVFPEKFETPQARSKTTPGLKDLSTGEKAKPVGPTSPVEAGKPSGQKQSFTENDLTPEQKSIMNQFVKGGIMTKKQYIDDIAKLQEA